MTEKKDSLVSRLNAHPVLKQRIESILEIVEDNSDEVTKADEAEQRVIEELQRLGNEALHDWARGKEAKNTEKFFKNNDTAQKHGKKNCIGIARLEQ